MYNVTVYSSVRKIRENAADNSLFSCRRPRHKAGAQVEIKLLYTVMYNVQMYSSVRKIRENAADNSLFPVGDHVTKLVVK